MESTNRIHNIFWGSSYDRGLDTLLYIWPDIKEQFPDAQLHICYGWDLFDRANGSNAERMGWKRSVQTLMQQEGVKHYGRIGKDELAQVRSMCGIWAYPTWFPEINCITALECQYDGVVPVVSNLYALKETVGSGVKVDMEVVNNKITQKSLENYKNELISLMKDQKKWKNEQKAAKKFAKTYFYKKIAQKWDKVMQEPVKDVKVSVATVTVREGWWNIMAHNLAKQTYKIHEWVIVDDYKTDRSEIAKKYAKKYDLNIKYIWGDKAQGKYNKQYGLAHANNTAWEAAEGDLIVWIQDFIVIPEDGVEALVRLHRHHPDAFLAPVDEYFNPIEPNKKNKEDWWNGNTDILEEMTWRNPRVSFKGIRRSINPFEFEMNYSATPKKTLEYLNGWYEFFDNGMGYDNTEIGFRALEAGFDLIIDDTNICKCIEIGHHGFDLNIEDWAKFKEGIKNKTIPLIRDKAKDK